WCDIVAMFEFPPAIRKAIYTTNAIESVNSVIRKFTRNRKQYPSADSAVKLVFLAISEAAAKWTMPIVGWKQALNHFAILFEGRCPAALGKSRAQPAHHAPDTKFRTGPHRRSPSSRRAV